MEVRGSLHSLLVLQTAEIKPFKTRYELLLDGEFYFWPSADIFAFNKKRTGQAVPPLTSHCSSVSGSKRLVKLLCTLVVSTSKKM